MSSRRNQTGREGVKKMVSPIVVAGLFALAVPLLAPDTVQGGQLDQTVFVVTQVTDDLKSVTAGKRIRGLITSALVGRGYTVREGQPIEKSAGPTILRVTAERRILKGAYTTRATVGLRATLLAADTKQFIARFDVGSGHPWRLASHCAQSCIDHELQRRVRLLAARLAHDVDRLLVRFGRSRKLAAEIADRERLSIAFHRIDRTLLPQIEQYLRNFPGVIAIRRDYSAATGVLYRLDHDGADAGANLSIRKMLHHLQITARIARNGNTYVIHTDPAAQPAAASQDW